MSGGIRLPCSCKSACWILQTCLWPAPNRLERCYALRKNAVTDRPIALPVDNSLISQNPFSANPIFKKEINSEMPNIHVDQRDLPIKHQPKSKRYYFDVGIGSVCLFGEDTGGAYTLLEASLAPGI